MTIDTDDWENGLTPKQLVFVREYLIDLNATQAAIRAGYSARGAQAWSSRLLARPAVKAAISALMAARAARVEIAADRVIQELARIGFADIRKVVNWQTNLASEENNPNGDDARVVKTIVTNAVQLVASNAIDDDTAAAISEISQSANGCVKVKLHDKRAALVDLGRHLGIFKDKVELTGKDGGPIKTEDVSARELLHGKLARLAARGGAQDPSRKPDGSAGE